MADYEKMSIEELEQASQALMQQRSELRERHRELVRVLDAKRREQALAEDLAKIGEKHGVVISPQGIASQESVQG